MMSYVKWGGIVLGAALAAGVWSLMPTAASAGNGKPHKAHGKVVSVAMAADGTRSITIQMHKHVKNAPVPGVPSVVETKTFRIGPTTVFEIVTEAGAKPVTLAAIHNGEHVVIEGTDGRAQSVAIVVHKHKHKVVVGPAG